MKRFFRSGTAWKAVVVGVVISGMATACQNGNSPVGVVESESQMSTSNVGTAKQIIDSQQIAQVLKELKEQQSLIGNPKSKGIASIHGVGNASGSLSGITASAGGTLKFTGSVSGVDGSDMVVAGLRALVEFENAYGQTLSIWEYRDGCGFPNMNSSEKAQGYYTLTTPDPQLAVPSNVKTIRISLSVWDLTNPSTHYKFLDYQVITLP